MKALVVLVALGGGGVASAKPAMTETWRAKDACGLSPQRSAKAIYTLVETSLRVIDPAAGTVRATVKLDGTKVGMLFGVAEPNVVVQQAKQLYGFAVIDGAEKWHRTFDAAAMVRGTTDVIGARRETSPNAIVVERVDAVTGKTRWTTSSLLSGKEKTNADFGPIVLETDGVRAVIDLGANGDPGTTLEVVDAKTGATAWRKAFPFVRDPFPAIAGAQLLLADDTTLHFVRASDGGEAGTLALLHGKLGSDFWIVGSGARAITSDAASIFAIDVATRKIAWTVASANDHDEPVIVAAASANAVARERVALTDHGHGVRVLAAADGALEASHGLLPGFEVLFAGDDTFAACDDDDLVGLRPGGADVTAAVHGHFTCSGGCPPGGFDFALGPLHGRINEADGKLAGTLTGRGRYQLRVRRVGDTGGAWMPMGASAIVDLAKPATFDLGTVDFRKH